MSRWTYNFIYNRYIDLGFINAIDTNYQHIGAIMPGLYVHHHLADHSWEQVLCQILERPIHSLRSKSCHSNILCVTLVVGLK